MAQLALALAAMAVLLAVSHASSSSNAAGSARHSNRPALSLQARERLEAAHRVEALYAGIPQQGEALGDPKAPVTLQFFADLECLEARQFALGALPFLVRRWVRSGKLQIVYHGYPEETLWSDIFRGQQAATLAAGKQGRLWQYLDFFYHLQGPEFTRYAISYFLEAMAREVRGLDFAKWQTERGKGALARKVAADVRLGTGYGLRPHHRSTPAFFIGPTGGRVKPLLHFSLTEPAAFDEAVEGVLGV